MTFQELSVYVLIAFHERIIIYIYTLACYSYYAIMQSNNTLFISTYIHTQAVGLLTNALEGRVLCKLHTDSWPSFNTLVCQVIYPRASEVGIHGQTLTNYIARRFKISPCTHRLLICSAILVALEMICFNYFSHKI